MNQPLTKVMFLKALSRLDALIDFKITLIVGGGGAMVLAHNFPLATFDLDAIPKAQSPEVLDKYVKQVALEQGISGDWLNPYFSTFTHTLPADYGDRLISVFSGRHLDAQALGREDLLIMKCFAGRPKDIAHSRALIKAGSNIKFVEEHIESLKKKRIHGADKALDYLDNLVDSAREI